jgi:hypothetical protein
MGNIRQDYSRSRTNTHPEPACTGMDSIKSIHVLTTGKLYPAQDALGQQLTPMAVSLVLLNAPSHRESPEDTNFKLLSSARLGITPILLHNTAME